MLHFIDKILLTFSLSIKWGTNLPTPIEMKYKVCAVWKIYLAWLLFFSSIEITFAQIIRVGIKAGPQLSWVAVDDRAYKSVANVHPIPGFHAGVVVAFKVKDRYFLNTEYIYSQKGKNITGKIDPELNDRVVYHHVDVPILFAMHFKGNFLKTRQFKWYVNAGPTISYWLGGKGVIKSGDLLENGISELKYKIAFGTRPDRNNAGILYIKDAKRFQFGMNFGGGILLEPGKQKIMIDFRYEVGHTRLGNAESSQFLIPSDYQDNLKQRNKGFRLSLIYLYEFSSDRKVRNKGKSSSSKHQ